MSELRPKSESIGLQPAKIDTRLSRDYSFKWCLTEYCFVCECVFGL